MEINLKTVTIYRPEESFERLRSEARTRLVDDAARLLAWGEVRELALLIGQQLLPEADEKLATASAQLQAVQANVAAAQRVLAKARAAEKAHAEKIAKERREEPVPMLSGGVYPDDDEPIQRPRPVFNTRGNREALELELATAEALQALKRLETDLHIAEGAEKQAAEKARAAKTLYDGWSALPRPETPDLDKLRVL